MTTASWNSLKNMRSGPWKEEKYTLPFQHAVMGHPSKRYLYNRQVFLCRGFGNQTLGFEMFIIPVTFTISERLVRSLRRIKP